MGSEMCIRDRSWSEMRIEILKLTSIVEDYLAYLRSKNMLIKRSQCTPRSDFEKKTNVSVLPICAKDRLYYELVKLDIELEKSEVYQPLSLKEHLPAGIDRRTLYYVTEEHLLKMGSLQNRCIMFFMQVVLRPLFISFGRYLLHK